MHEGLATFLHNGRALRTDAVDGFCEQLDGLIACFEQQTAYHFYSSSLLMIYDGHEGEGARSKAMLKVVDFAHVRSDTAGARDEGFLFGLKSLRQKLGGLSTLGFPNEFSGGLVLQPRD